MVYARQLLCRLRIDAPFAVAKGGEGREEERWMEDSETDACNADHPRVVSKVNITHLG